MRAIILTGPGEVELVSDRPEVEPGPDDVVVAMRAVGLCGSDLSVFDGSRNVPELPWVMGHEGGGDIVAVGSDVHDRSIGQCVVIEPNYCCLRCTQCLSGQTSACPHREIVGINVPGLLAERVVVPARFAWPVPDDTPPEFLASIEPLAVARSAVQRSGAGPGDECLVVGAGSQGLFVCQSLLAIGARPFVVEPMPGRAALAEQLGARLAADGQTYSCVFETAGVEAAVQTAVDRAAPAATVVLIGLSPAALPLSTRQLVRRQLTLRGALIYDHPGDFSATLTAVEAGEVDPSMVVCPGFAPGDAADAFAQARTVPGKAWIDLTGWHGSGQEASGPGLGRSSGQEDRDG